MRAPAHCHSRLPVPLSLYMISANQGNVPCKIGGIVCQSIFFNKSKRSRPDGLSCTENDSIPTPLFVQRNLTNSGVGLTKEMTPENRPSAEEDTSSTTEYKKRIEIIEPSTRGTSTDSAGDADAFAPPKETLKERRNTARITPVVCDIRLA
ncbi:unnamed protein product, partial [Nesidiocoris tenuis]